MSKRALIFGIGGQDGSYLADLLLSKGYEVHGTTRRSSVDNLSRVEHCVRDLSIHRCDLCDAGSVERAIRDARPDEIYNEADQDHVGWSHDAPDYSVQVTAGGVSRILEAVLRNRTNSGTTNPRIFIPVSAKMFGNARGPQDEQSLFAPDSPYACAKVHVYHLVGYYRRVHNLHVNAGIMYNHDSPRRGPGYLLQEVCRQAREKGAVKVGDPDAEVDIGFAGDYMEAAYRIMQLPEPDDFIISTGDTDRVYELAYEALKQCGVVNPVPCILPNPDFPKHLANETLVGNPGKLKAATGWHPKVQTRQLIKMILEAV